jgi:hypothetical protein
MHGDDGIELGLAGVGDHPIADDPGIVDQDVKTAEGIDGSLNEPGGFVPVRNVGTAGDRLSPGSGNLLDNGLCGATAAGWRTIKSDTNVVDHNSRTLRSESKRMRAPDPAAGTGDNDNPTVEQSHG